MKLLQLTTPFLFFALGSIASYPYDPHNVNRRELHFGQLANLQITLFSEQGCTGQNFVQDSVWFGGTDLVHAFAFNSYILNRTLAPEETIDWSINSYGPDEFNKEFKPSTTPAPRAPAPASVTPAPAPAVPSSHTCLAPLYYHEKTAGMAVPSCGLGKRDVVAKHDRLPLHKKWPAGSCSEYTGSAPGEAKLGGQCFDLPAAANCFNVWVKG